MGRQGKKITPEEGEKIMECLGRRMTPREMAPIVKRSANCIYVWIRAQGIELPRHNKHHPDRVYTMSEELDYSLLPDSILFNAREFPAF